MKLEKITSIHFIGIKGTALSALAVIALEMGKKVTGSDVKEEFITDKILLGKGIVPTEFHKNNIHKNIDLVVVGTSFLENNIETQAAKEMGLKTVNDSQFRGMLSLMKKTIAVTGVHGKTTTTALLAFVFSHCNKNPSWLIGTGKIPGLGGNGHWGEGKLFIVEGDEYVSNFKSRHPKFLDLSPAYSIITNIEWEHVDVFKNVGVLENAFAKLIENTSGKIIACTDWPSVRKIIKKKNNVVSYGIKDAEWVLSDYIQRSDGSVFKILKNGKIVAEIETRLTGIHNALNITAVFIVAREEGLPIIKIKSSLKLFKGLERRFDIIEKNGITFVDDYGHHPTEIVKTLNAAREKYMERRIWCIFQPHMASRTKALMNDFKKSFHSADNVLIADIFASAREKDGSVSSKDLADAIKKSGNDAVYTGTLKNTYKYVHGKIQKGDVVITMGAGDVYKIRDMLVKKYG